MKKTLACLLAVLMIVSTGTAVLAAASFEVRLDKEVYSPGGVMQITVAANTDDWYTVEIMKDGTGLMALPFKGAVSENIHGSQLDITIPGDWKPGDYVVRAGQGADIASAGFTLTAGTDSASYTLTLDKTTVLPGDTLVLSGTSSIAAGTIQYVISGSGTPKTGDILLANGRFECPVTIDSGFAPGPYTVKVGAAEIFSEARAFTVASLPKASPVVASPKSSAVASGTTVTLSTATQGAAIYYTLDNTTPTKASALYTGGIVITGGTTLMAIAVKDGYTDSDVMTETYTLEGGGNTPGGNTPGGNTPGGSTSPSGGAATPEKNTVPANGGAVSVDYTESDGAVTLALPASAVTEIIGGAKGETVTFNLSRISGAASAVLPKAALTRIADAKLDVKITLPQGTVTLSAQAAASAAAQAAGGTVALSLSQADPAALTEAQREAVGPEGLVFDIKLMSGKQLIGGFDGQITVTVPYTGPQPVSVWYLSDKGELEKLDCTYSSASKSVTFVTTHLSLYVVGPDADSASDEPFSDVGLDAWYHDDVLWAFENGLMNGTGDGLFSPDATLTRAMIVTILWRSEGEPEADGLYGDFADTQQGAYYETAVAWAAKNGIVQGYGEGFFGPDDTVTRQDLAVILMRFMAYKEINPVVTQQWIIFADEADIAEYAMNALQTLNKLGIINGVAVNDDGQTVVSPKGNATRAQAAALLHRFMELTAE